MAAPFIAGLAGALSGSSIGSALGGSVLSGIGSAITGGLNLLGNKINYKQAYKYQQKLMDYQNQLNIENWNMQNEYNSPSAQMQRYSEAGLNPNLIYGQSNSSSALPSITPGSSPKQDSIFDQAQALNLMTMAEDLRGKKLQNDLTQQDIYNRAQERKESDERIGKMREEVIKIQGEVSKNKQTIENLKKDAILKDDVHALNNIDKLIRQNEWEISENKVYLSNQDVKYSESLMDIRIKQGIADIALTKAKTAESGAMRSQIIQATNKLMKEINLLSRDIFYYDDDREIKIYIDMMKSISDRLKAIGSTKFVGELFSLQKIIVDFFDKSKGNIDLNHFKEQYELRHNRYDSSNDR